MNGTAFKLATLAKPDGNAFVAIVLGDDAVDLKAADAAYRTAARKGVSSTETMLGLLDNWNANFAALAGDRRLSRKARFAVRHGEACELAGAAARRPARQDVLRGAELSGTCRRDDPRRHVAVERADLHRREIDHDTVSVPQGAELSRRRLRRYRDPARHEEDRLGGRDRARHRQRRQAHQGRTCARSCRRVHDYQRRLLPRPANARRIALRCARTGSAARATTILRRWGRSWCRAPSCRAT